MQAVGKCRRSLGSDAKPGHLSLAQRATASARLQPGSNGHHWLPHNHGLAEMLAAAYQAALELQRRALARAVAGPLVLLPWQMCPYAALLLVAEAG